MKKFLALLILLSATAASGLAQTAAPKAGAKVVTFRFVPGNDMFYIPWAGNGQQLDALCALVDTCRAQIADGRIPIRVEGYCASSESRAENLRTAAIRSNRVKSELITRKGLKEADFITKNHAAAYTDPEGASFRDMVVVTLRIPVKAEADSDAAARAARERAEAERLAAERAERDRLAAEQAARERAEAERLAAEQAERERLAAEEAARRTQAEPEPAPEKPYCVAVRTNVLYDAMLLPTIGVEWRVSPDWGIKLDGSLAWWGGSKDKVQKVWLLNPEVRRYLLRDRRFYVGASGSYGEYNLYKYPVGSLFSKDTGYQGSMWSAGLTVGYQLYLSRRFSVDFNLGLGYTRSEYDSFNRINAARVYKERDKSKNFWGPTQAGIHLVWTIGGNR